MKTTCQSVLFVCTKKDCTGSMINLHETYMKESAGFILKFVQAVKIYMYVFPSDFINS